MWQSSYEQQLLSGWEEVYKKGQLTLWIMLALKDGPKHMSQLKLFIVKNSGGTLSADDKSLYRALRRYYDVEMLDFSSQEAPGGPDLKVYRLTELGSRLLESFLERNIIRPFYNVTMERLIKKGPYNA